MVWSLTLFQLFEDVKLCIISSPVLARYGPDKSTFFKIDWSAEGIDWIMMQPADNAESLRSIKLSLKTIKYLFKLTINGTRLRQTGFGFRCCLKPEKKIPLLCRQSCLWVLRDSLE